MGLDMATSGMVKHFPLVSSDVVCGLGHRVPWEKAPSGQVSSITVLFLFLFTIPVITIVFSQHCQRVRDFRWGEKLGFVVCLSTSAVVR